MYINNFDASNLLVVSGVPTYLIAAALSADINNITVSYTLEPGSAGVTPKAYMNLFGFEAGNGGTFVPPPASPRRIDIIGDSITAGSSYDRMQSVGEKFSLGGECGPWTPVTGYSQACAYAMPSLALGSPHEFARLAPTHPPLPASQTTGRVTCAAFSVQTARRLRGPARA